MGKILGHKSYYYTDSKFNRLLDYTAFFTLLDDGNVKIEKIQQDRNACCTDGRFLPDTILSVEQTIKKYNVDI